MAFWFIERMRAARAPGRTVWTRADLVICLILAALLLVVVGFAAHVSFRLKPAIIPDEPEHFLLSQRFSTTWGIPGDDRETYMFGPVEGRSYLYYWLNGRIINILHLFRPHLSDWKMLVSLRLVSLLYNLCAILFAYLLSREVIQSRWAQLLAVFLLTNTLMFLFLAGGVNYDSLVNLSCMAAAFFLVRVFNGKAFYENSLSWLLSICAGALTKITVLPLALIMALAWLFYVIKNRPRLELRGLAGWKSVALLAATMLLVALNLLHYGGNLLAYGALQPSCTQLWTASQCNLQLSTAVSPLMLPQKLTVAGAVQAGYPGPIDWILNFWIGWIMMEVYGFFGHQHYFPSSTVIALYRVLLVWILLVIIRYAKRPSFAIGGLFFAGLAYLAVLQATNYDSELSSGFKHIAIQGRYIFPVIGILYTLVAYYVANIPHVWMRRVTAFLLIAVFLYGGLFTYWINYSTVFAPWFY